MLSRRKFIKSVAAASAGAVLVPNQVLGMEPANGIKKEKCSKNDKVKMAFVGIGNRGEQIINDFENTGMIDVVALCDVDLDGQQCQSVLAKYPKAKRFRDFREMFDKCGNEFDAVAAAIPDFAHFSVAMLALNQGKHIYLEKPMCRTFHEAELLMAAARKHPELATQVGNQGHSEANYFQFKAWKEAGIIKDVTAVTAHMNNSRRWHGYDAKKMYKMPKEQPIPSGMDWDTWNCSIPYLDFNDQLHQGNWRSWYETGMGCLGDWGAHLLDTVHEFLELGLPYEINMLYADGHNDFFFPYSSTLLFRFAQRNGMPPVDVTWYDGIDNLPPLPEGYGGAVQTDGVPATNQNGSEPARLNPGKIIYSKDLIFKGGSHGSTLSIIPEEKAREMASMLPEVPESPSNHFENFLLACQGKEKTRSPFEINGVLSQVFCLGVIAQRLNTRLFFDPRTKQFTNNEFANAMLAGRPPRRGWEEFFKM